MEDRIIKTRKGFWLQYLQRQHALYPDTAPISIADQEQDSPSFIGYSYKPQIFPPLLPTTRSNLIISITSYEWEMKNFSSHSSSPGVQLPHQPRQNNRQSPESRQQREQGRSHDVPKNDDDEGDEEDGEKPRCEWDFNLSAVVSSGGSVTSSTGVVSDTLGVVEIDPSDRLLATGGISRKIRVYRTVSLLPHEEQNSAALLLDHATACDFYICTPAKLSCLRWKPGSAGVILGAADYDGVVMEYDLEKKLPVFERDEHGGRRIWSMDYSPSEPVIGASGSDDGTMQMWDPRCDAGECLAMVQPSVAKSPICCVEFNPFRGDLIAVGCADRRVYGYDLRRMADPLLVLDGHRKAVTYIRFMDHNTMVTSGIDGSLKMWHTGDRRVIRTYTGHVNSRRFVGLSVWRGGGLMSCGSEDNQVVVYDKRWGEPIWTRRFEASFPVPPPPPAGPAELESDRGFVSSVCWSQMGEDHCTLVAGGSDGVLQIFRGRRVEEEDD